MDGVEYEVYTIKDILKPAEKDNMALHDQALCVSSPRFIVSKEIDDATLDIAGRDSFHCRCNLIQLPSDQGIGR